MTQRTITRRRVLIGGTLAAGAAVAGAGAVTRRRSGDDARVANNPAVGNSPATTPVLIPTPVPRPRGGVARIPSPVHFNFDTFDAQRTGEPSVLEVLGRTHSRLLDWGDSADPILVAGLATSWEQPDAGTLLFHLDPRAHWDDRSPTNGRAVTAEDVRAHFVRHVQLAKAALPIGQRAADFANLQVYAPETSIVGARPGADPWALQTFASRYAFIQAPEAVDAFAATWTDARSEQVRGSGPFRYTARRDDGPLVFESARGGHTDPNLDGLQVFEPGTPDDMLARRIDEYLARDRRDTAMLRKDGRLLELSRYEDSPVISTFFIGSPPWNNPALLRAISGALNRGWLSQALFGGRADPCGPISPASGALAPSPPQVAKYAGFGADAEAEARAARAAWDTAGGPALGPVTIDFPSIFDPLYSASSVVVSRLNDVLGPQFRAAAETYTTISSKAADGRYGNGRAAFWFGWGPPMLEPDPSRMLVETYSSSGPNASALGLKPGPLDGVLAEIGSASLGERPRATAAASLAILEDGGSGIISWLLQYAELFRWPYISGPVPGPFWRQHVDHARMLDPASASYPGRGA